MPRSTTLTRTAPYASPDTQAREVRQPLNLYDLRLAQIRFEQDQPRLSEGAWLALGASLAVWVVVFKILGWV